MITLIEHIVKYNERVDDILNSYHVELDELVRHNTHITDFNRLLSGSKLMIPIISREVEQVLDKTEGFVMDYYPKISEDLIPNMEEEKKIVEVNNQEIREDNIRKEPLINNQQRLMGKCAYPGILPPKRPYKGRF